MAFVSSRLLLVRSELALATLGRFIARTGFLLSALFVLAARGVPQAPAGASDAGLQELARVKAEYETDLAALGDDLLRKLDDAQAKERAKPAPERDLEITKKRIEYIVKDREALLERAEWPTSISIAELRYHWVNDHRGKVRDAYKNAIAAATRRGDDASAKALTDELGVFDRTNDLAPWQSLYPYADRGEKERAWMRVGDIFTSPSKGSIGGAKNPLRFRRAIPAEYALRFKLKWIEGDGALVLGLVDARGQQFDLPIEPAGRGREASAGEHAAPIAPATVPRSPASDGLVHVSVSMLRDRFSVVIDGTEMRAWKAGEEFPVEREAPGEKGTELFVASNDAETRLKLFSAELKCMSWGAAPQPAALHATPEHATAPGAPEHATPDRATSEHATSDATSSAAAASADAVQAARYGKPAVIAALLRGIDWLIRHQDKDGGWKLETYTSVCPSELPCIEPGQHYSHDYDAGVTGLATLALVRAQEYFDKAVNKERVDSERIDAAARAAVASLVKSQKSDGSFTRGKSFIYNEALGTLALTTAYGFTRNAELESPARRAVEFIVHAQRPSPLHQDALWGWRYASRMEIEDPRNSSNNPNFHKELHDSDTSATGWAIMALRKAQNAGLDVKKENLEGAFEFVRSMIADNGFVGYTDRTSAGQIVNGPNDRYLYHPGGMSALAMCVLFYSKHDANDPFIDLAARRLRGDLPSVSNDKLSIDYYYWFCGSVALDQLDGPDSLSKGGKYWNPWNKALVEALLSLQNKNEEACANGAWLVPDRWSFTGGPIYATAINLLDLEDTLGWK